MAINGIGKQQRAAPTQPTTQPKATTAAKPDRIAPQAQAGWVKSAAPARPRDIGTQSIALPASPSAERLATLTRHDGANAQTLGEWFRSSFGETPNRAQVEQARNELSAMLGTVSTLPSDYQVNDAVLSAAQDAVTALTTHLATPGASSKNLAASLTDHAGWNRGITKLSASTEANTHFDMLDKKAVAADVVSTLRSDPAAGRHMVESLFSQTSREWTDRMPDLADRIVQSLQPKELQALPPPAARALARGLQHQDRDESMRKLLTATSPTARAMFEVLDRSGGDPGKLASGLVDAFQKSGDPSVLTLPLEDHEISINYLGTTGGVDMIDPTFFIKPFINKALYGGFQHKGDFVRESKIDDLAAATMKELDKRKIVDVPAETLEKLKRTAK